MVHIDVKRLFSNEKFALLIQLFYKAFETANPLGSRKVYINSEVFFYKKFYNKIPFRKHAKGIKTFGFDTIPESSVT